MLSDLRRFDLACGLLLQAGEQFSAIDRTKPCAEIRSVRGLTAPADINESVDDVDCRFGLVAGLL